MPKTQLNLAHWCFCKCHCEVFEFDTPVVVRYAVHRMADMETQICCDTCRDHHGSIEAPEEKEPWQE
jgi:hypothetical protein